MVATTKTLAQIPPSLVPPLSTDQLVGVTGGPNDVLFTLSQLQQTIPQGPQGAPGPPGPQGPSGIVSGVPDPISLTKGLFLNVADPIPQDGGATFSEALRVQLPAVSAVSLTPGFTNLTGIGIEFTYQNGDNSYGSNSNGFGTAVAKTSVIPFGITGTYYGAGQKFGQTCRLLNYGMGDSFIQSRIMEFWSGNIAGDEGAGYSTVSSFMTQGTTHATANVVSATRATLNTTATQAITGAKTPQTITVASAAGANVGDWIVVNQYPMDNNVVTEAVKLTAVNVAGNTVTGVFRYSYTSGVHLTPALVLAVTSLAQFGQQRVLVNLSGASYTTGTITGNTGGALTGSGTTWTTNMVGGNAANIGAIALNKDTLTAAPWASAPLLNWYQIISVASTTSLGVFSNSTAGDASYRGVGTYPSTYTIRPAARILYIDFANGLCICETSTHVWNNGDTVECVMCPYPDVSADSIQVTSFSTGGTYRTLFSLINSGARTFGTALNIKGSYNPSLTGNADKWGFGTGIVIAGAQQGIMFNRADVLLVYADPAVTTIFSAPGATLATLAGNGLSLNGFCNAVQGASGATNGLAISSTGGASVATPAAVIDIAVNQVTHQALKVAAANGRSLNVAEIDMAGVTVSGADKNGCLFSQVAILPAAVLNNTVAFAPPKGALACITDSTTNTAGAIINGGGTNSVIGWFNGTNWIVMGTH